LQRAKSSKRVDEWDINKRFSITFDAGVLPSPSLRGEKRVKEKQKFGMKKQPNFFAFCVSSVFSRLQNVDFEQGDQMRLWKVA
jgi:hypothetical protein